MDDPRFPPTPGLRHGLRRADAGMTARAADRLDIKPFLTLSTAHISRGTAKLLEDGADTLVSGGRYGPNGWFMWCTSENLGEPPIPGDLWKLMEFARAKGCDYLLLDRDGQTTDELPVFDWEAPFDPYEAAARAAGWDIGGDDVIFNARLFDGWKDAVSWAGEDPSDEARNDSTTYSTWRECCEGEGIEVKP